MATAFTIVALPAIWLFTRGQASSGTGAPSIAAAGVPTPQAGSNAAANTESRPFGTNGPIFIDGPTVPQQKSGVIQIVVPATAPGTSVTGGASYKSIVGTQPDSCAAPNAPFDAVLTVTNTDNGRSVICINRAAQPLGPGLQVLLNTNQYIQIASLVDAPVPVSIQWSNAG